MGAAAATGRCRSCCCSGAVEGPFEDEIRRHKVHCLKVELLNASFHHFFRAFVYRFYVPLEAFGRSKSRERPQVMRALLRRNLLLFSRAHFARKLAVRTRNRRQTRTNNHFSGLNFDFYALSRSIAAAFKSIVKFPRRLLAKFPLRVF